MAKGRRFADAVLAGYVDKHDFENQEQFSALHVYLSDGTLFVSYSGTDDTILGWKEDLNMAYQMPVPSQEEAVGYLEKTVPQKLYMGEKEVQDSAGHPITIQKYQILDTREV